MNRNHQKKVLIIDDDPDIIDSTKTILDFAGYTAVGETNNHTIQRVIEVKPDLIFLDLWLTEIDGRELCRQIKTHPKTKKIPVLLFSASRNIQQNAKEAQANDYIAKPFELDELLQKIDFLLN
ncbi:MAG: response regulator [Patescibacteria group bacterium]